MFKLDSKNPLKKHGFIDSKLSGEEIDLGEVPADAIGLRMQILAKEMKDNPGNWWAAERMLNVFSANYRLAFTMPEIVIDRVSDEDDRGYIHLPRFGI